MTRLTEWLSARKAIAKFGTQNRWRAFKWGDGSQEKTATANVGCDADEITIAMDVWELDANHIADAHNSQETLIALVETMGKALEQADCTCGSEGPDSDHSYQDGGCFKHDALASVEKLIAGTGGKDGL